MGVDQESGVTPFAGRSNGQSAAIWLCSAQSSTILSLILKQLSSLSEAYIVAHRR